MRAVSVLGVQQINGNGQPDSKHTMALGVVGNGHANPSWMADAYLVRQAQGGNGEALEDLLERQRSILLRQARCRCGNCGLAEDLCQEACLRLVSHLSDLHEPEAFAAWMGRLLSNATWHCRQKNCKKICTPHQESDSYQVEDLSVEAACGAESDWQCLWNSLWQEAGSKVGRRGRVAAFMLEYYNRHEFFPSVRMLAHAMHISVPTAQGYRVATLLSWRRMLRRNGLYPW